MSNPSNSLIGLQLFAATVLGAWLGFDRAATAGAGFWLTAAGLFGGAVFGLVLGTMLAVLVPSILPLLKLFNSVLWIFVATAIRAGNDLARHMDQLAYLLMLHRARILPAARTAEEPVADPRASADSQYDWLDDDSQDDGWDGDDFYVPPGDKPRKSSPSPKLRNLTRLAWAAAIMTGAAVAYGGSAKSWQEIALAGAAGALVGQFFPLVVNFAISFLAALIRLAGEILLGLLLSIARILPAPIRRGAGGLERGWAWISYYPLEYLPYRFDEWLTNDRPFRA